MSFSESPRLRTDDKKPPYHFTSERLGYRPWTDNDYDDLYRLCSDERVMQYFPGTLSPEETAAFLQRLQRAYQLHGYCYFAVERLANRAFIGFIGLAYQTYDMHFAPAVDIGWRLLPEYWGRGYATEGAERCKRFAFEELQLEQLIATTTHNNEPSIRVMERIGMSFREEFIHPNLDTGDALQPCLLYDLRRVV